MSGAIPALSSRSVVHAFSAATIAMALLTASILGRKQLQAVALALVVLLAAALAVRLFRFTQAWSIFHDLFSPLVAFPAAYLLWFGLGSVDWLEVPSSFSFGLFDPIPPALWMYIGLGLAGYCCGVLLLRNLREAKQERISQWNERRVRVVLIGLFVAVCACWSALGLEFGIPGLSSTAAELRLRVHGPFYILFILAAWTALLFLPLLRPATRRGMVLSWAAVIAICLFLASFAGRSNLIVPLLSLVIARHYAGHRIHLQKLLAIALVMFIAVSFFGYARDLAESEASLDWLTMVGVPRFLIPTAYAGIYVRYSIATFRDVVQMIPVHLPYQHGTITLAPLRTFLPGHQEMSDVFFKRLLGNDFVGEGQPATLLGPFYADFGAPGIFVGMFLFGAIAQILYRRMQRSRSMFRILLYAWVLQSGLFGLFANVFPYITTLLLPSLWFGLDRFLRTRPESEARH